MAEFSSYQQELQNFITGGKNEIAKAVTAKGVSTPDNSTFQVIKNNISQISSSETVRIKSINNLVTGKAYGIWYINPMGEMTFRRYDTEKDFTIEVIKNSFFLPLTPYDGPIIIDGDIMPVSTSKLVYNESGKETQLLQARGNGTISLY